MWYEGNETDEAGANPGWAWRWGSWRVPTEYLPLLVGLCCGIAVVLLALSTVVLWRCCLLRRKQKYCDGKFCEMGSQSFESSKAPREAETAVYAMRNGPWAFHSRIVSAGSTDSLYAVPRSHTITAIPTRNCSLHGKREGRPSSQAITKELTMIIPPITPEFIAATSATYVRAVSPSNSISSLSYHEKAKSTPTLEDIYAQVNFSKKRKNRMGKDDAAIIALSKSRTELDCGMDSVPLACTSGAQVVYNERTAL